MRAFCRPGIIISGTKGAETQGEEQMADKQGQICTTTAVSMMAGTTSWATKCSAQWWKSARGSRSFKRAIWSSAHSAQAAVRLFYTPALCRIVPTESKAQICMTRIYSLSLAIANQAGECWYCQKSYTARCPHGTVYGSPTTPGCQAEYFVQPLADGCLFKVPDELRQHGFPLEVLLLLADVLPTGYSAAFNARRLLVRIIPAPAPSGQRRSRVTGQR